MGPGLDLGWPGLAQVWSPESGEVGGLDKSGHRGIGASGQRGMWRGRVVSGRRKGRDAGHGGTQ